MKHFLFSFSFALIVFVGHTQKTYLQCGQLIDVRQLQVLKEKTIVVEGNKILDILDGYQSGAASDKVVNLKTSTVMPGLMDMHVHIENETNPNRYLEGFTQSQADIAYGSLRFAEKDLMAGFTAVRDLGGSGANIAMRKAIQKGYVVGPRIFTVLVFPVLSTTILYLATGVVSFSELPKFSIFLKKPGSLLSVALMGLYLTK